MSIDIGTVERIKDEISKGARGQTRYRPVSLSQALRERFQEAANDEMAGDFSHMLELVLRLYLDDPRKYPLCWLRRNEGPAKNKPVTLSDSVIQEIQEEAEMLADGVFARLVQGVVRGYLVERGYLERPEPQARRSRRNASSTQ